MDKYLYQENDPADEHDAEVRRILRLRAREANAKRIIDGLWFFVLALLMTALCLFNKN